MGPDLRAHLDRLVDTADVAARLARDPIRVPRRYARREDVEVAALFAALLAYGRVDLFLGVLDRLLAVADGAGGPRAWVDGFDPARDAAALAPLGYRWTRGADVALLVAALGAALRERGAVEDLFDGDTAADAITAAVAALRAAAARVGPPAGLDPSTRGFRHLLPSPADGSGCKRWNLLLRWMVRPADGVDLGLWTRLDPARLVMPVDRHVQRIAPLIGLVPRADGSWRSAVAITRALAALCPEDPVRYDFALAHLGISDGCRGAFHADVCPGCPVRPVCVQGALSAAPPADRKAAPRRATRR